MKYFSWIITLTVIVILVSGEAAVAGSTDSNAQKNKEIVAKYYEYYSKGDIDGIKSVMADDVEWHIPGHHPLAGTKKGINEVVAFFKQLQKAHFKAEVLILAANDDYVIDCHRGWGESGNNKVDMNWVLLFKIENGKIQKVQNFAGDQHGADSFFWSVYELKPIPERLK
ncbi:MAG: nuclear transport factor 2 family protein [Vulcanimicrobiota bacterium]